MGWIRESPGRQGTRQLFDVHCRNDGRRRSLQDNGCEGGSRLVGQHRNNRLVKNDNRLESKTNFNLDAIRCT